MPIVSDLQLKNYFLTGKYPTQGQFANFIDSKLRVDAQIPMSQVIGLQNYLNTFHDEIIAEVTALTNNVKISRNPVIVFLSDTAYFPIGENMVMTNSVCNNIASLSIKAANDPTDNNWKTIPVNTDLSATPFDLSPYLQINAILKATFTVLTVDQPVGSAYLFCNTI